MDTDEHLSQPLPHPEEPVDELSYIPHSHQTARAVSISPIYIFLNQTLHITCAIEYFFLYMQMFRLVKNTVTAIG
jgi:hypothetical protein